MCCIISMSVHGERKDKAADRDIRGLQMAPPKSPPPLHECHLLIDKGHWPVKNEQYTVSSKIKTLCHFNIDFCRLSSFNSTVVKSPCQFILTMSLCKQSQ